MWNLSLRLQASLWLSFSLVAARRLQSLRSIVVPCGHNLVVLWHVGILVPHPGIEPACPALEGAFLTIGLPGKSLRAWRTLEAGFTVPEIRTGSLPGWVISHLIWSLGFALDALENSVPSVAKGRSVFLPHPGKVLAPPDEVVNIIGCGWSGPAHPGAHYLHHHLIPICQRPKSPARNPGLGLGGTPGSTSCCPSSCTLGSQKLGTHTAFMLVPIKTVRAAESPEDQSKAWEGGPDRLLSTRLQALWYSLGSKDQRALCQDSPCIDFRGLWGALLSLDKRPFLNTRSLPKLLTGPASIHLLPSLPPGVISPPLPACCPPVPYCPAAVGAELASSL